MWLNAARPIVKTEKLAEKLAKKLKWCLASFLTSFLSSLVGSKKEDGKQLLEIQHEDPNESPKRGSL